MLLFQYDDAWKGILGEGWFGVEVTNDNCQGPFFSIEWRLRITTKVSTAFKVREEDLGVERGVFAVPGTE